MWLLLAVLALSMMGAGGAMFWQGLDIILVERGWSFVIAGTVLFAGGALLLALSLVLRELRHIARDPLAVAEPAAATQAAQPEPPADAVRRPILPDLEPETVPAPARPGQPEPAYAAIPPAGAGIAAATLAAGAAAFAATRSDEPREPVSDWTRDEWTPQAPAVATATRDDAAFDLAHLEPVRLDPVRADDDHADATPARRDDPAFDELTADFARIDYARTQPLAALDQPTQLDADRAQEQGALDDATADGGPVADEAVAASRPATEDDSAAQPPVMRPAFDELPPPPAPAPANAGRLSTRLRSWLSPAPKSPAPVAPPPLLPPALPGTQQAAALQDDLAQAVESDDRSTAADRSEADNPAPDLAAPDLAAFERELTERLKRDLALRDDWAEPEGEAAAVASGPDSTTPDDASTLPAPDLDALEEATLGSAPPPTDADKGDLEADTRESLAALDPLMTGGRDWSLATPAPEAPDLRPALDEGDTGGQPSAGSGQPQEDAGYSFDMPVVVRTYTAGDNSYVIFSDGSIEADTPDGHFRFSSIDEMKAFVAGGGKS
jgi:hypothetical protein